MPTLKEAHEKFAAGAFIAIAEYRGFKPDAMRYRDKKTGARVSSPILIHLLEVGDAQVKVTEWLPDGAQVDAAGLPVVTQVHKKGERVILKLENLESQNGQMSARGKIFKIEEESKKA